jgi:hypothetical protein
MARHTFGGTVADYVVVPHGDADTITLDDGTEVDVFPLALFPGGSFTLWTAQSGGEQVTDLLTLDGAEIETGIIVADDDGNIPQFQGPDNDTTKLWADGGRERVALVANDLDVSVANAEARSIAALAGATAAQARAAKTLFTIEYDPSSGAYPTRASSGATVERVQWIGPVAPIIGGDYAMDGFDLWLSTVPAGS